jgi:mono/diheme cytochrome c family protein
MRTPARAMVPSFAAFLLISCGGPSSYSTSAYPPIAVAHVIGAQPTSAAGADPVTAAVRSQSQVTLTGNASSGGASAIGSFAWTQTDAAPAPQVALLYLDSDTVTFTAPTVGADTTLHFTLTVTTVGNTAATAHAAVLVKAVNDPNQFLAPLAARHFFKVAVATKEGLGKFATPAEALSADVPVCVTVSRTIDYVARDGSQPTVPLPALKADASWVASVGGAGNSFGSYSNPQVAFAIPALNQDDIAVLFNNPVPGESSAAEAARLAQQLVPSDIGLARLSLTATAAAGSCDGTLVTAALASKTLEVQVLDESGNAVGSPASPSTAGVSAVSAAFTPDLLISQTAPTPPGGPAPTSQYETADTARAYYDANDPGGTKTNLTSWLNANCFTAGAANYGATAHSVYTNNYDLGFGRDMYFTICTPTSAAVTQGSAKAGDMAAVVLNYVSLEAAAGKLNPINAVAMEYSISTDGSNPTRRFPKFYIFAPNDRDGTFQRVPSANFDHRGEKYVPGACVMCHGGTLPQFPANFSHVAMTDAKYATIADPTKSTPSGGPTPQLGLGDVDATFMPWDLDSFLYSDTDPTFVGLSVSASKYTRSAQEPNLKSLNQLAYCTYQPEMESVGKPATAVDRLSTPRLLMAKWYGGSGAVDAACPTAGAPTASLLPGPYDDTLPAPGWMGKTFNSQATTLTSDLLYHQVFARNCRSCHTQNANPLIQFSGLLSLGQDGYESLMAEFAGTGTSADLGKQYVLNQGRMPLARLTMDRFWVNYAGGDSAAKTLATHVQQLTGETDLLTSAADAVPPGSPVLGILVDGSGALASGNLAGDFVATRFAGSRVDAESTGNPSFFVADYSWTLCVKLTQGAPCTAQSLVGATTAAPGIDTTHYGYYELTSNASNGLGAANSSSTTSYEIYVPDLVPAPAQVSGCPANRSATFSTTGAGPSISVAVGSCFTSLGDPPYTLQVSDNGTTFVPAILDPSLPWNASVVAGPPVLNNVGRNTTLATINFNFNPGATGNATLTYQLCDTDVECAVGTATVTLASALTANPASIFAYWDPALNYSNYSAGTIAVPPAPAVPITLANPNTFVALMSPYPYLSLAGLLSSFNLDVPGTSNVTLTFTTPTTGALSASSLTGTPSGLSGQVAALTFTPTAAGSPPLPLPLLTCDINNHDLTTGTQACQPAVAFNDTLASPPSAPSSSTVTIDVQALVSYNRSTLQSVYGVVQQTKGMTNQSCSDSSCHGSGGTGSAFWTWSSDPTATYNSFSNSLKGYVIPGNPDASPFYTAPCKGSLSPTMPQVFAVTSKECQILYQWILEGGVND